MLGTRPEIIRLSKIIPKLDAVCEHILIHTGQNYDENMSGVFFKELGLREPNYFLGIGGGTFEDQLAQLGVKLRDVFDKEQPERLLVLGDTNSALSAFIAKRRGIKVYHMEAGNRCYSDLVPEEINRRVIDACSDMLMPYTERSRANLIREGYQSERILVTGNPIWEVIEPLYLDPGILRKLKLENKKYLLVTAHRQENVDSPERLNLIMESLCVLWDSYKIPIIFSCHPRTKQRMQALDGGYLARYPDIIIYEPFGFRDFVALEKNAKCVLTDSGTVQEECCILKVPCVTLRDNTERSETIECGSNILAGVETENVLRCVKVALSHEADWNPPSEYLKMNVSDTVVKIVTGF